MQKGLKLFGLIVAGFFFFSLTWFLSNLVFALIRPESENLAGIAGLVMFVLPWCLAYGVWSSRKKVI